jgi:hypothetical protein
MRLTRRRQEHLATLGLPIAERSVLEVGAGIGDHTDFFVDRGCRLVVTEGRPENVAILRQRYPTVDARLLDLDYPDSDAPGAEIVYCYGTLYHLSRPAEALQYMSDRCTSTMLLETCVRPGDEERLEWADESRHALHQSMHGRGCRPTRSWVRSQLRRHFPHVYIPRTQPWHEEFPLDWNFEFKRGKLTRAIFIASREPIDNHLLSEELLTRQTRHP